MLTRHEQKQERFYNKGYLENKEYILYPWQQSYIKRIKESLLGKNYKDKTLIDIGTGLGYIAIELAKLGINVIACDLSPEAINNLKKHKKKYKLKNLKLLVCRAQEIPLKDKSVDYIVANALLEHIPEERETIAEWKRILKPGGKMFITTPLKYRYGWPIFFPLVYIYDKKIGHLRRYDLQTFRNKFKLPVEKVYYTGHSKKMIFLLLSKIRKLSFHDEEMIEHEDAKKNHKIYGAQNIIVVLKKPRSK